MMTPYQKHVQKWASCERCNLSSARRNTVLVRGKLPCDVLFIGEAPGVSEDVLGRPFIGPAGKLLDRLIEDADPRGLRLAFTNLVGCIPLDDAGEKTAEPPLSAINSCAPRLTELAIMARPRLVVFVGKLAEKYAKKVVGNVRQISIIHPAAILRMDVGQQGLTVQRVLLTLAEAFGDLGRDAT